MARDLIFIRLGDAGKWQSKRGKHLSNVPALPKAPLHQMLAQHVKEYLAVEEIGRLCSAECERVHHMLALAHQQQENNTTHLYHFKLLRHAQPVHKLRIPLTQLAVPCCLLLLLTLGRDVILNRSIQIS